MREECITLKGSHTPNPKEKERNKIKNNETSEKDQIITRKNETRRERITANTKERNVEHIGIRRQDEKERNSTRAERTNKRQRDKTRKSETRQERTAQHKKDQHKMKKSETKRERRR